MVKPRLMIVGAGGHGRSVAEAAQLTGLFEVVGFLDDSRSIGTKALGWPILGPISSRSEHRRVCDLAIVAIGDNTLRRRLMGQLGEEGFEFASVFHPRAFVSESAVVGPGTSVMAAAVVGTEARLGVGVIVNCGAIVDHHAQVGDFGHLGVNACMAGGAVLGRGAWMQAGSALGYEVAVPDGSVLRPGESLESSPSGRIGVEG